jgi:hypothetical protein
MGRDSRADEARQKIRMVGELIRLSCNVKISEDDALQARIDRATAELDAGKGVPIARVREDIKAWAKDPNK